MDLESMDVHQQMMDIILGFWASQIVRAIADFSVADHLAAGGLTAAEVAARGGTAVDSTYRLTAGRSRSWADHDRHRRALLRNRTIGYASQGCAAFPPGAHIVLHRPWAMAAVGRIR